MREIKFRAWARRGEWGGGEKQKFVMLGSDVLAFEEYELVCDLLKDIDDDFYLMQYTGLRDSYGIEEYFGDVIEDEDGTRRVIDDGCSAVLFVNTRAGNDIKYFWKLGVHKVIGNIYENPELDTRTG